MRRKGFALLALSLLLGLNAPVAGLGATQDLRAALGEFLARCVLAERAGVDPAEIERIAAPVVLPGPGQSAREALELLAAAGEELSKIFPGGGAHLPAAGSLYGHPHLPLPPVPHGPRVAVELA